MSSRWAVRGSLSAGAFWALAASSFLTVLAVWSVLSWGGMVKAIFLPTPWDVVEALVKSAGNGTLWADVSVSLFRIVTGFALAMVIGIPLGLLVGTLKPIEALVQPLAEFVRYIPVPVFIPLIMVWVGIGEEAKITVVFIGTFFQVVLLSADDARSVPQDILDASRTLGSRGVGLFWRVLWPAVAPRSLDTARTMFGGAWTFLVVAELVAANNGMGYSILKAQRYLRTDDIFAGILVIGLIGLISDRLFVLARRVFLSWDASSGAKNG